MHSLAKLTLQGTCLGFTQVCPSAAEGVEEKSIYNRRKQLVSLTTPKLRWQPVFYSAASLSLEKWNCKCVSPHTTAVSLLQTIENPDPICLRGTNLLAHVGVSRMRLYQSFNPVTNTQLSTPPSPLPSGCLVALFHRTFIISTDKFPKDAQTDSSF